MPASVAQIYLDGTYASKNQHFGDDNAAWKAKNVLKMFRRAGIAPKSVCEVGCGGGGILVELQKQMPGDVAFTGIEPMPEAMAICSGRTNPGLAFYPELEKAPAGVFDVIVCLDVFEHVEDYIGFLRSLRTRARHFVFHIPLDMNVQMLLRLKPLRRVRESVGHLHYFCKDTALMTLKDSGYHVKDWFYTNAAETGYSSFGFRLLKLPRKILFALAPDFTVRVLGGYPLMVCATAE